MKHQNSIKLLFTGLGAFLFNALFWEESLGLNTLIFAVFIMASMAFLHRKTSLNKYALLTGGASLFSAIMVVINFSFPARLALVTSSVLTVGFLHQHTLKSAFYAFSDAISIKLPTPEISIETKGSISKIFFSRYVSKNRLESSLLIP